jgi:hypothetical protein
MLASLGAVKTMIRNIHGLTTLTSSGVAVWYLDCGLA